jgi:hypothetical protein
MMHKMEIKRKKTPPYIIRGNENKRSIGPMVQPQKDKKQPPTSFNSVPKLSSLVPFSGGGGDFGISISANVNSSISNDYFVMSTACTDLNTNFD